MLAAVLAAVRVAPPSLVAVPASLRRRPGLPAPPFRLDSWVAVRPPWRLFWWSFWWWMGIVALAVALPVAWGAVACCDVGGYPWSPVCGPGTTGGCDRVPGRGRGCCSGWWLPPGADGRQVRAVLATVRGGGARPGRQPFVGIFIPSTRQEAPFTRLSELGGLGTRRGDGRIVRSRMEGTYARGAGLPERGCRAVKLALHPSEDPDLARAQDGLRTFLAALSLTGAERSAVHVAVLEAMVNAVRHGHSAGQRAATLDLEVVAGQIVATVTDYGPGFDPVSCPDPFAPERMRLPHGRGVLLMRALMDDVDFTFPPGGGTRVTLRRALPSTAPTGA
ncbi:ATP-binding protein [Streptomyces kaniharaensis]|uniref:ATP-binding protein n=1 Tax=Streptomyces kaniharaensis TaxID=212423 RepID=A0A6N7KYA9_9ACTN|nr:ATP-binding protein [Streptomyces kaniharaensis]